eukprot:7398913-Karenia_brevis.AAC.1
MNKWTYQCHHGTPSNAESAWSKHACTAMSMRMACLPITNAGDSDKCERTLGAGSQWSAYGATDAPSPKGDTKHAREQ